MEIKKIDFKNKKFLKILTIFIYVISILIYEIGICNGESLFKAENTFYNFSLSRTILYVIFMVLLVKNIDRFLDNAINSLELKSKKILIWIYIPVIAIVSIYVLIRWISIYKALSLIIALLMGLIFIIYVSADFIKNTIIITATFGIVFTFSTDFNHAIDEKKHIMSAVNISEGHFNYVKDPYQEPSFNNIIFNCDIDSFIQFYAKKYEPNLNDEWNRTKEAEIYYVCSSPADYNFILYLPSSLGITYTKLLHGSVADAYITGRLFNLITYAIMISIVLKLLPYKKKIFYVIYMLPFTLLLSASYSVDGICVGLIGIFIAYCLKLAEKDYKEIKLKQILIIMALFILCLISKNLAYCAMILFVLILPIFKILKNNKKQLPIIITLIAIAVIACGFLALSKFGSTASSGGDPRGGATSVMGQINFLLSSPLNIVKVGFEHVVNSILNYNWYVYLNNNNFFGKYYSQIFFLEMIFIIFVSITDNSKKIKMRTSIVSLITFICVYASTSLMLYLTFTPVGQINIAGYQPRYLIPILPSVLMLINNKRFIGKSSEEEENKNDINVSLISGFFILLDLFCLIYVI